VLRLQLAGYAL
jgi:hypothetical protein